jgi:hypothetical protein
MHTHTHTHFHRTGSSVKRRGIPSRLSVAALPTVSSDQDRDRDALRARSTLSDIVKLTNDASRRAAAVSAKEVAGCVDNTEDGAHVARTALDDGVLNSNPLFTPAGMIGIDASERPTRNSCKRCDLNGVSCSCC